MRSNKRAVYATAIISVITLFICFRFHQTKPFIYDVSLACFGSSALGLVVAYTAYSAERREAMEQFWDEGVVLTNGIRKIKHIECCAANYLQLLKSDYPQLNKEKSVGLFKI